MDPLLKLQSVMSTVTMPTRCDHVSSGYSFKGDNRHETW